MEKNADIKFHTRLPSGVTADYVVIVAKKGGKWLFIRHSEPVKYEMVSGPIDRGVTPRNAAETVLRETAGTKEFTMEFVAFYTLRGADANAGGSLYFAELCEKPVPSAGCGNECILLRTIPKKRTRSNVQITLFHKVQRWLNTQNSKNELWDILDKDRQLTGRTQRRGDALMPGDYHLIVHVWILNGDNEFLITRRSVNKGYPHMWECTGGAAVTGDSSRAAAAREVFEETGISVEPERGELFCTDVFESNYRDVWVFRQNFDLEDIVLQEGETCDAQKATAMEIRKMIDAGEFMDFDYIGELFSALGL